MEIITIEGVGNVSCSSVGERDSGGRTAKTCWHASFITIGWVHRPVPVRQTNFISYSHGFAASVACWILLSNLNSTFVENLFKQSKIRPVPGPKHIASVGAVAHHLLALHTFHTIPLPKWDAMNS